MIRKITNFIFINCLTVLFVLLSTTVVRGQEMFGLTLGNYNALTGSTLNPAVMTGSRNFMEINVIGFHYFANNDAFYIPASDVNFWNLWKPDTEFPTYGPNQSSFKLYDNRSNKSATSDLRIIGPSAMMQYGKHAFAIRTGVRFFTSGADIPFELPVFGYVGLDDERVQNIEFNDNKIDASSMAWMEVGLSYAYDIYQFLDTRVTVGITVNKLWGYAGVYGDVNNVDYIVLNDSTLNILNLNGEAGFSLPVDYDNNDVPMHDPLFKGSGLGIDIGAVYTKRTYVDNKRFKKPCGQRYEEYDYRIGLSILDIGRVKFKNNAQLHSYDDVSAYWQNFDTLSYSNVNQAVGEISNVFYGDPSASYAGSEFKLGLPTAVSLQVDYRVKRFDNVYVSGIWVQPIRFNRHTLKRGKLLAIVPRYETRYLEFNLPLMLYDYQYPRIGFSARFSFLTVGTERIGTYLGLADLNGMDIYFSIKFNLLKGNCKEKVPVKCLNYEYGYSDKDKAKFRKRKY